jgi:hypothetical protein
LISEGAYVNTGDVSADTGTAETKLVHVPVPEGYVLAAFKLGVDSWDADVPGVRISAQLQARPAGQASDSPVRLHGQNTDPGAAHEVIGHFLYRSPFRPLHGDQESLPAPYPMEPGEELCLFIKLTNQSGQTVSARANVSAWFVSEQAEL